MLLLFWPPLPKMSCKVGLLVVLGGMRGLFVVLGGAGRLVVVVVAVVLAVVLCVVVLTIVGGFGLGLTSLEMALLLLKPPSLAEKLNGRRRTQNNELSTVDNAIDYRISQDIAPSTTFLMGICCTPSPFHTAKLNDSAINLIMTIEYFPPRIDRHDLGIKYY